MRIAAMLFVLLTGEAAAAEKPAIAVMPLQTTSLEPDKAAIVNKLIAASVSDSGGYDVVSTDDINAMLGLERMKEAAGCNDVTCAAEIGAALGVEYMFLSSADKLGNSLVLTTTLLDRSRAKAIARHQRRVSLDEDTWFDAVANIVSETLARQTAKASTLPQAATVGEVPATTQDGKVPAAKGGEVRVYRSLLSDHQVNVALLPFGPKANRHVLIRMSGVDDDTINNRTLLYDARPRNTGGTDYYLAETNMLLLSSRRQRTLLNGSWHEYSEVHLGRDAIRVIHVGDNAPVGLADELRSAYRHNQGYPAGPHDRTATGELLDQAVRSFAAACGHRKPPNLTVAWAAFDRRQLLGLPATGKVYLDVMGQLCSDPDYREVLGRLTAIAFSPAKNQRQHAIRIQNSKATFQLAEEQPNVRMTARRWLEDNL